MIRPCRFSLSRSARSFAFVSAFSVEGAMAAGGALRMADLPSKPDQIGVKGVSSALWNQRLHLLEGIIRGTAVLCEPETATQAMHMRVNRENIPPQCEHENTCGGLRPYAFEPGKFFDDIFVGPFSKGCEIVIAVQRMNGAKDLPDAGSLLVRHPPGADGCRKRADRSSGNRIPRGVALP